MMKFYSPRKKRAHPTQEQVKLAYRYDPDTGQFFALRDEHDGRWKAGRVAGNQASENCGMSQNTSHAVMQQRHEAHDSLDDFPTPPWAVRALCEHVIATDSHQDTVWEPSCNRGYMVRGLQGYFKTIQASDIHDYGGNDLDDFLLPGIRLVHDWIITNPPFRLAAQFADVAIERAAKGVALLVRTAFLEGGGRYRDLFMVHKPYLIAQFAERVPMVKGRCDPRASTATSYCWIVWAKGPETEPTEFMWIPPCRKQLERPGDYA